MAIELALVFPTMLIVIGGSIVLARAYSSDLRLTRLTQESVRVCAPGTGVPAVDENSARQCIEDRFNAVLIPGCLSTEITMTREETLIDYVNRETGVAEVSAVPHYDVTSTCQYSTVGTRGVFPVMTLTAQSRALVD